MWFQTMGFSLFRMAHFSEEKWAMRNNKPPAMRARDKSYTKNHLSDTIELFKPLCNEGKGDFNGK